MGIASFAVIGVLSLVPGGLATLRSSVDASAVSRIMRTVAADARQSTNFAGIVSTTNYFDDNGLKLDPANKAKSTDAAAVAKQLRTGKYDSAVGTLEFDAKGDIKNAVYDIYVWKGGKSSPMK